MVFKVSNKLVNKYAKVIKLVLDIHPAALVSSFLYAMSTTMIPYVDFWFLGSIVNELTGKADQSQLVTKVVLFVTITYLLNVMAHFLQKKREVAQSQLGILLDEQITKRLLTVEYASLEDPNMRENYQKAAEGTNYNGGIATFINQTLTTSFQLVMAFIVSGAALIKLYLAKGIAGTGMSWVNSWWFLLLIITLILLPVMASTVLFNKSNLFKFEQFNEIVEINREFTYYHHTVGHYQNGMTFRLYRGTQLFLKRVNQSNSQSLKLFFRMERKDFSYTGTVLFISSSVTALLYVIVGLKAFVGAIAIGSVILYAGYLQQLLAVLLEFFKAISMGNTIVNYIQYYYDFLHNDSSVKKGSLPVEKRNDNEYEIEFHHVGFKYPRTSVWVLKDFSLQLKVGERLSVVGRNGSGKTTFIKLLCRLYEPTKGILP
nr:ABC transporter ATP-binding protein [uncultured Vagococcus sp.]